MLKSKIQNPKSKINPKSKCQTLKHRFCHLCFVLCALSFVIYADICYAQSVSSTELINNAKQYDGKVITYEGEVIGDIMVRQEFAWVNINDGTNAVGIWVDKNLTQDIIYTGSYKSRGDWVEATGEFRRACPQHGGDLDIHAQELKIIKKGSITAEKMSAAKRNWAVIFLIILCIILILRILKAS
jgi:hypothetical protein